MQSISVIGGNGSAFRLRRPLSTSNGLAAALDPRVAEQLDTLEDLLGLSVFDPNAVRAAGVPAKAGEDAKAGKPLSPKWLFSLKTGLTPQRTPGPVARWAADSVGAILHAAESHAGPDRITLGEFVDRVSDLATLKYAVDDALAADWYGLPDATKRVLDASRPATRVYLVAYAYLQLGLRDAGAIKNFVLNDRLGAALIAECAVVGAARSFVADRGYQFSGYEDDHGDFVTQIRAAGIGLGVGAFAAGVQAVLDAAINDVDHAELIDHAETALGVSLPLATKRLLAQYIDAAPVTITDTNVTYFVTVWLTQIGGAPNVVASPDASSPSDDDFAIDVFQDDDSALQISRSAILCAGQLYYSMVLGDELDVFAVLHYFTHRYLVSGGMEIQDGRLRDDLQAYVFSNRYTDLRTGRLLDRTRPSEREMFYHQVFAMGHGKVPHELMVNSDFSTLWKTLMLESADYLERAQASLNPDGFVSRQKVMQAVEDLQYNLSTHCTGMATVITPLIHGELNFVIRRILMHPEVLQQVVPVGGTWWRVVERLYQEMKHAMPKATAFYNKAKLGHDIIGAVADYDPASFEDDTAFSGFISTVDAYITTQSILQDALTDDLKARQEQPTVMAPPMEKAMPMPPAGVPAGVGANGAAANGHAHGDDWDF